MLLVCILDKIGTFGMLRFCLGLFPDASQWATVVVVLALVSVVYGALVAIGQDDVLRLIGLPRCRTSASSCWASSCSTAKAARGDPLHGQPRDPAPPRCSCSRAA
ncbi:MAG: proton-conducting transporter membrane subunit [Nocardioides sp.]